MPSSSRSATKAAANVVAMCLMTPLAATCFLERKLSRGEGIFNFWTHVLAVMPGQIGVFMRRGFYRLTLAACGRNLTVAFGGFFAHRDACVDDEVYIGPFAVIGRARLGT